MARPKKQDQAVNPEHARRLRAVVAAPQERPSVDAFLDHFFAAAGGPERVAKMLYTEYTAAPPGSMLRQRTLELVLRTLKASEALKGPQDNLSDVADEDIARLLELREKALLAQMGPPDAPTPAPPGPALPAAGRAAVAEVGPGPHAGPPPTAPDGTPPPAADPPGP